MHSPVNGFKIDRPTIILFCDWYAPAFKAGGPIRSAVNFVENLKAFLNIYVFTSDRDLNDQESMPGIDTDKWLKMDGYMIFYATPSMQGRKNIQKQINAVRPDYIYLNSMFSFSFTILPLLIKMIARIPATVVLSPRGMLRSSAIAHKRTKKKIFLAVLKVVSAEKKIIFHATDGTEENDIRKIFPQHKGLVHISNLPGVQRSFVPPMDKRNNYLKLIFVGRMHTIKNLDYLLECLKEVKATIDLMVIAANDDTVYRDKCFSIIKELPANITVDFMEDVENERLANLLESSHVFILPTKGENFGHAIYEALAAGRPVIISDQTPWRGLQKLSIGYDLPLGDKNLFVHAINHFAAMDNNEISLWGRNAWTYIHNQTERNAVIQKYLKVFSLNESHVSNQT